MKYCPKCKENKSITCFHKNKNRNDGLSGWCKCCLKSCLSDYYIKNKERILRRCKKYYIKNSTSRKKYSVNYFKTHPWLVSYVNAKQRCINPKKKGYKNYGGKGVKFFINSRADKISLV